MSFFYVILGGKNTVKKMDVFPSYIIIIIESAVVDVGSTPRRVQPNQKPLDTYYIPALNIYIYIYYILYTCNGVRPKQSHVIYYI